VASFPLTDLTWRLLMPVPNVVMLGAGFLGMSYWLFHRREEVAAAEGALEKDPRDAAEGGGRD
jgi:hypothetical protein